MDAELEEKTGRQIAVETIGIAPVTVLWWLNNFETHTSIELPSELRSDLVLETEYFALYYLRKQFANHLDSETSERVLSNAMDILAFLLSTTYFQVGDSAELEPALKVTLRDSLNERTRAYANLKATFFARIVGRLPTIADQFATIVYRSVFSRANLSKKVAGSFADDMAREIYGLKPGKMIEEAKHGY